MANVLVVAERRKRITPADAARAVELLMSLPIRLEPGEMANLRSCHIIAGKYALSAYDACYLEIAQRLGLPLATLDRDLISAAQKSGVSLLCK
jgi:predicted nucleic acid-binding protein